MSSSTSMSNEPPIFIYESESQSSKLARKTKEYPYFPLALGVFFVTAGYGAYMYKRRGTMGTSQYLMQLRVTAQGLAVGTITIGLLYSMYQEHFKKKDLK